MDPEIELIKAAYNNNIEKIMSLIKQGVDIDTLEQDTKNNALMIAARYGHRELVAILLNFSNININACQDVGYTPLMLAAQEKHTDIMKMLLAIPYIDVDHRSVPNQGKTYDAMDLYLHACREKKEKPNQKIINLFDQAGCIHDKIKEYTKGGKERVLIKAIEQNDLDMVTAILASPRTIVDVNQRSRAGDTALMVAMNNARNNPTRLAIIEALLSVPTIDLEITNAKGQTAVDLFNILKNTPPAGGMNGNAGKIKELDNKLMLAAKICKKIKRYPKDQYILITAIQNQDLDVIDAMLACTAKINIDLIIDNQGNSALVLAKKIGNPDIIQAINNSVLAANQAENAELIEQEDLQEPENLEEQELQEDLQEPEYLKEQEVQEDLDNCSVSSKHDHVSIQSVSSEYSHISIRSKSPPAVAYSYYETSIASSSRENIDPRTVECATLVNDDSMTLAPIEKPSDSSNSVMLPPKKRPRPWQEIT